MCALEGLLVVAIEQAVAAPLCSSRLAAAGARVIKIERPEGDFARGYDAAACGESAYFTWLNQGKESACLDFKTTPDADILALMLKRADVLVQNLAPGALARAGFSTESLHEVNPGLIVCNISGYGPDSRRRGYDLLVQAESGLISVSGSPEAPGRIGVSVCDIAAGLTAYSGVLEALLKRQKTGVGEVLSVSLFDVAADWMTVPFIHAEYGDGAPEPVGLKHPSIAPYGAFNCADGRQVLISIQNEREWQRLCAEVLKAERLATDERFLSNNLRVRNRTALEAEMNAITEQLPAAEFQQRLEAASIANGAINRASDLAAHPAFSGTQVQNSGGESLILPAPPIRRAVEPLGVARSTPKIGEHTAKIRDEFDVKESGSAE
jgi:crotonobetainyl-CoA:carnitine CoA-transferase CaiB-like acyl-CoA transferase